MTRTVHTTPGLDRALVRKAVAPLRTPPLRELVGLVVDLAARVDGYDEAWAAIERARVNRQREREQAEPGRPARPALVLHHGGVA
jgi:hypothetical protein